MKRSLLAAFLLLLVAALAACVPGRTPAPVETPAPDAASPAPTVSAQETETAPDSGKVIVVVFSATGTTKAVAEKIADIENAELFEIVPKLPYTAEDLDWTDSSSRATVEQHDKNARPEIAGEPIPLDGCSVLYLGYPIWWGEEPRIMDTFVESCDLGGITVIPFCTSGSSGVGMSAQNLAALAKGGIWRDGTRFPGGVAEAELKDWIDGMK